MARLRRKTCFGCAGGGVVSKECWFARGLPEGDIDLTEAAEICLEVAA